MDLSYLEEGGEESKFVDGSFHRRREGFVVGDGPSTTKKSERQSNRPKEKKKPRNRKKI